jgi:tight adherence protein B
MSILLIVITVFVGVAALVGGFALMFIERRQTTVEQRLNVLAQAGSAPLPAGQQEGGSLLAAYLKEDPQRGQALERFISQFVNLSAFVQQAGVSLHPGVLVLMSIALASAGGLLPMLAPQYRVFAPLTAMICGAGPFLWVFFKRRKRLYKFESQMPRAMELLARSLRAGHSIIDGIRLIGEEMPEPISGEFQRCYEQQQLGVLMEDTLEEMTLRVPSLDLRFFVTSILLQRQTGGDAAEILDKIGYLIRERFQIRGQVKALTAEGRLSGVVLLALPILLAIYMYFRNPEYVMMLFDDPLGVKMVIGAIGSQILGALVIKKIVDIKV